jgi:allatostatin C receptor
LNEIPIQLITQIQIEQVVSTTAWAASFLMIVPIFLYAHTQQVNADWPPGGNTTGLPPTDMTPFNRTTTAAPFTQPIVSCNIYWPESEYMNGQAAFTLYTFTLAFAIPLVLILVFYILVIRKLQVSAISRPNFRFKIFELNDDVPAMFRARVK